MSCMGEGDLPQERVISIDLTTTTAITTTKKKMMNDIDVTVTITDRIDDTPSTVESDQ